MPSFRSFFQLVRILPRWSMYWLASRCLWSFRTSLRQDMCLRRLLPGQQVGKGMLFDNAEANAFFFLNLFLQTFNKSLIGFIGHDGERVHVKSMYAVAVLVNTDAQAASDFLTLFDNRVASRSACRSGRR
jgi:hypothetical protein